MSSKYFVICQPTNGPTLKSDTIKEFNLDRDFVVIKTNYMPFQLGWRDKKRGYKFFFNRRDILDAEEQYGISFHIDFVYKSVKEHLTDLAEDDFAVEDNLNLLLRGM